MVAFFKRVDPAIIREITEAGNESNNKIETSNAYIKTTFGIVHVRSNGERVLVVTHGVSLVKKRAMRLRSINKAKLHSKKLK